MHWPLKRLKAWSWTWEWGQLRQLEGLQQQGGRWGLSTEWQG